MNKILTLAFVSLCTLASAQIKFVKGYYIDSVGMKTEGWIRNTGWQYAPASFMFKPAEESKPQSIPTSGVQELVVGDDKYIRTFAKYDGASQEQKDIGVLSNPEWTEGSLLLKVLVEGKAKLYHYSTRNYSLFFFSTDSTSIEQLVFKNYLKPEDRTVMLSNRMYLAQLNTKVRCETQPIAKEQQVGYNEAALTKYFRSYNTCMGDVNTPAREKKRTFQLRLTTGVNFVKIGYSSFGPVENLGKKSSLGVGADLEFTLPFHSGKWCLISQPNYYTYHSKSAGGQRLNAELLEVSFGIRHKFFVSKNSHIFVNATAFVDTPLNHYHQISLASSIETDRGTNGFAGGVGFALGRLSAEARYYPKYERIVTGKAFYGYERTSLLIGFRLY